MSLSNKVHQIKIVPIASIKPNPKNRNKHSEEQIMQIMRNIEALGFRDPPTISNQSGLLVTGHGTLIAAKKLGYKELPVIFQDFDKPEDEYAFSISHNSLAKQSELDFAGINLDLPDLGPDFDIDLLGIKNFTLDMSDKIDEINKGNESSEWVDMPEFVPGEGYIKLIYIFPSNESREKFVKEKELTIDKKISDQWIIYVT